MAEKSFGLNPWLTIWVKPRQTIRSIVNYNVSYRFLAVCFILGFLQILLFSIFTPPNRLLILPILFILAPFFEYLRFTISAALLFWGGKLLKGKGSFKQIRAAVYWTSVPEIAVSGVSILLGVVNVLFGELVKPAVMVGLIWSFLIFWIWIVVIFICALGEVQKFSTWMAILNIILATLFWFALIIITSFLFGTAINLLQQQLN